MTVIPNRSTFFQLSSSPIDRQTDRQYASHYLHRCRDNNVCARGKQQTVVPVAAADPASAHQRCVLSISDDDRNANHHRRSRKSYASSVTKPVSDFPFPGQQKFTFNTCKMTNWWRILLPCVFYTRKFYHKRVYADTPDFVARNETRMPIGQVRIRSILIGIYTLGRIRAMVFSRTRIGGRVRPKCNGPPGEPYESN